METLIKFKQFVDEITAEAGRNYKISVLEKYKDDEDIKYLLDFIFNPYITTGISDKKLNRVVTSDTSWLSDEEAKKAINVFSINNSEDLACHLETLRDTLEYLKTHNTGRDVDIVNIHCFESDEVQFYCIYNDIDFLDIDFLFRAIITKNIQLGVDVKTINKVIPGLIPEFNVQLSNKYFDKPEVVEGKEFTITTKIDGSRIIAIKDNGKVSFYTRQGQKYEGLIDLEEELKIMPFDNFVLDGEIVAINTDKENTYKNTMKLSRTKDLEKHGLKMLVFDYMPVANWKIQKCPLAYHTRRTTLSFMFDSVLQYKYFELLPLLYVGTDTSKITEILEEQTSKGEEGIMINIWDAPYDFKRTNNLLKCKKFKDCDLIILGFEEGTNKLAGTLGALILDYKGNELRCGSGFSDEQRAIIWANRNKYLGKIAEIKYFEETTNQNGGISLRFPTFKDIRDDKTEPNY